jgi:transposase
MASFYIEQKGNHQYIVMSQSYRHEVTKKPTAKKLYIGRVNQTTKEYIFKESFLLSTKQDKIIIDNNEIIIKDHLKAISNTVNTTVFNINKILNENVNDTVIKKIDSINKFDSNNLIDSNRNLIPSGTTYDDILDPKIYGTNYFLLEIAKKINLISILSLAFPDDWQEIFVLASYLIIESKKMMYCNDWISENETLAVKNMSSQRISDLFNKIKTSQRQLFFKNWSKINGEKDYIALDITSISSYSENIEEVEFGHNKDHDKLPQINICMLFGEKSYLPIYQTQYSGSLIDVSTLKTTINEFSELLGTFLFFLIIDRGFYSLFNIKFMLEKKGLKFIIGVPFTTNYSSILVKNAFPDILNRDNYVKTSTNGDMIYGLSAIIVLKNNNFSIVDKDYLSDSDEYLLNACIFYNKTKATREDKKFTDKLNDIKKEIYLNPDLIFTKYKKFVNDYLSIQFQDNNKSKISKIITNNDKINNEIFEKSCSILLTNDNLPIIDCYTLYTKKDPVEKSFHNYKSHLGLDRPYVHGSKRMVNKTFVILIAQIIYCAIHKKMQDTDSFKKYTIEKIFTELKKIKLFRVGTKQFLKPITKYQKELLTLFDIKAPDLADIKSD